MNILLTGGSGFIGRNFIEQLQNRHFIYAPGHRELDLTSQTKVDRWFDTHPVDVVVHCALKPGHRNASDLTGLLNADLRMFYNLLRNVENRPGVRMFNIGSGSCYDMRHYIPRMREDYFGLHIPADETGFAKYVISKACMKSDNIFDLRVFGIFGKYEDYAIRFISNAICKSLKGLPITLRQDRIFHYLWIDDFIRILELLFTAKIPVNAFNVTPDITASLLELANQVNDIAGRTQPIQVSLSGAGDEYSGDNRLLRSILPGIIFTPVEEAVKVLYTWYEAHCDLIDRQILLVDK